jgi:Putative Actinobacterial Holin-X, holin superfamily III
MPDYKDTTSEVSDLIDLTKQYVIQETVTPLKSLGRIAGFGFGAAILFSVSAIFVVLGVLRLIEDESGTTFSHHLSWVPYALAAVAGVLVLAVGAFGFLREPRAERAVRTAEGRLPEQR